MKHKSAFKKIIVFFLSLPATFLILEIGIRIVLPQPVDEFNMRIYIQRFSKVLNADVKSLKPGIIKKNNYIFKTMIVAKGCYYSKEKNKNTIRIAIVGSSVNFGFNLDLKSTFGKLLENSLKSSLKN